MSKWNAILGQVAQVAVNCLPLLLPPGEGQVEPKPYKLGDIAWSHEKGKGIYAYNTGDVDAGINYAVSYINEHKQNVTESVYQVLPAKKGYAALADLNQFKDGQFSLSEAEPQIKLQDENMPPPGSTRVITAGIASLMFASAWSIGSGGGGGFRLTLRREGPTTSATYICELVNPGPSNVKFLQASVSARDSRGATITASTDTRKSPAIGAAGEQIWLVTFPAGTNLEPNPSQVDVRIEVDNITYERLTKERRALLSEDVPAHLLRSKR